MRPPILPQRDWLGHHISALALSAISPITSTETGESIGLFISAGIISFIVLVKFVPVLFVLEMLDPDA